MKFLYLAIILLCAGVVAIAVMIRRRNMHLWLMAYLRGGTRSAARLSSPKSSGAAKWGLGSRGKLAQKHDVHLLLCLADHFEPFHGGAGAEAAGRRVAAWVEQYPQLVGHLHDADGCPPQHTFFYPLEQYQPSHLDALAGLCRRGFGEVEVHLHHDRDTPESLAQKLSQYTQMLASRHGLLSRRRDDGRIGYAFIHGNWALDNSHPSGRFCGVNNELDILLQTGCYADFTMPSAPDATQSRKINSIYWAVDDPQSPKSHDRGVDVGSAARPPGALMMIQGPLGLDWRRRKWGVLPRIENGCLQANQLPDLHRLELWLGAGVGIASRPDWFFVKLYTHGCAGANQPMLLGQPLVGFYEALTARAAADEHFQVHFVTARQMYNLACAAAAGYEGPVNQMRNFPQIFPI